MTGECLFLPTDSVLLYGDTGSGKTPQFGEAAEHVALTTGLKSLLYTMDRGGVETIRPHINLGMIEVESLLGHDPWVAIHAAVTGKRFDGKVFAPADLSKFGLIGFETISSMCDEIRLNMTKENAEGRSVGGKASYVVKKGTGADAIMVSSNTMVDYSVVQADISQEMWLSQRLGKPIIWTTHVQRGTEEESSQAVIGVAAAGKALATVIPRWFTYTFRLDAVPVPNSRARHILYVEEHTDTGLKGIANARLPLGTYPNFKPIIEPASIIVAMKQIRDAQKALGTTMEARLKAAGVSFK